MAQSEYLGCRFGPFRYHAFFRSPGARHRVVENSLLRSRTTRIYLDAAGYDFRAKQTFAQGAGQAAARSNPAWRRGQSCAGIPVVEGDSEGARLCQAGFRQRAIGLGMRRETSVARQRNIGYRQRLLDVSNQYPSPVKARSSVGERFLDTEEVGGSIPPVPTRSVPTAARAFRPAVSRND
jgi:hypothetical protein